MYAPPLSYNSLLIGNWMSKGMTEDDFVSLASCCKDSTVYMSQDQEQISTMIKEMMNTYRQNTAFILLVPVFLRSFYFTFSSKAAILSFKCSCKRSLDSVKSLSTVSDNRLLCSSFIFSLCLAFS